MNSTRSSIVSGALRRLVLVALFLFPVLFLATLPARAAGSERLFVIERSQNANYVQYDAKLGDGGLDRSEPVVAYWIMRADKGQRESLSWAEKKAFGFSVKPPRDAKHGFELALNAYRGRSIGLYQSAGRWRAVMVIGNKPAFLSKLFVQLRGGGLIPSVEYIDAFGNDVTTGAAVSERILPS